MVRSEMIGLNKMMQEHAEEAQDWIIRRVGAPGPGDTTEDDKASS